LGIASRPERNVIVKTAVEEARLKTGVFKKKSRARPGSPLYGKVYTMGAAGRAE